MTAAHVIEDARYVSIPIENKRFVAAEVIARDSVNDLAILEVDDAQVRFSPLPLATQSARVGTRVFTIGYPHPELLGVEPKLTTGIVNARTGLKGDPRTYQISVPLQSGNSGGPLLNMRGEVVGIVTAKLSADRVYAATGDMVQNVNYAIKVSYLRALMDNNDLVSTRTANPKRNAELETLAERTLPSVYPVIAHDAPLPKPGNRPTESEKPARPDAEAAVDDSLIILTYAEPGRYDINENIIGSSTLELFSKNLAKTLYWQLKEVGKGKMKIRLASHIEPKYRIARVDYPDGRKLYCTRFNTTWILSAITEAEPGANSREVTYRLVNCANMHFYKKTYTIQREEQFDRYGYETQLESSLRRFLNDIPSAVMARK